MTYQSLAPLYDYIMKHAPYDEWYSFTEEVIDRHQASVKTIADLGCGTGEITIRLAEKGYSLYGIDFSEEMLAHASEKAFQKGLNISWLSQDLRKLSGLAEIDLAISYCDVMNYITNKSDLKKTFENVHHILKDSGLFIFDVHSIFHAENNLSNNTFAEVRDDYSYIWFCHEGESRGEMHHDLTFFKREGNKYIRFKEFHHQKTYPSQIYKTLLAEAGFTNIKIYSDFSLEKEEQRDRASRIFFLAEKKG